MQFIYFMMFRATWFVVDDQVTGTDALVASNPTVDFH
jgi:hypothetical protein